MFTGKSKERVVSAAGRRKVVDKTELLANTQKQREERLIKYQREKAAIIIQARFRSSFYRNVVKKNLKIEFDMQSSKIEQLKKMFQQNNSVFYVPLSSLLQMLKSYIFFYHQSTDSMRLLPLLAILSESVSHPNPNYNYYSTLTSNVTVTSWQYQYISIIEIIMSDILHRLTSLQTTSHDYSTIICLENLVSFPTTISNQQLHTKIQAILQGCYRLLLPACVSLAMRVIILRDENANGNTRVINILMTMCQLALVDTIVLLPQQDVSQIKLLGNQANHKELAWRSFAANILTIPQLLQKTTAAPILHFLTTNNMSAWKTIIQMTSNNNNNKTTQLVHEKLFFPQKFLKFTSSEALKYIQNDKTVASTPSLQSLYILGNFASQLQQMSEKNQISNIFDCSILTDWISVLLNVLDNFPLVSLLDYMEKENNNQSLPKSVTSVSVEEDEDEDDVLDDDDDDDDDNIHDLIAGGGGVKRLQIRIKLKQRQILRQESAVWDALSDHWGGLANAIRVLSHQRFIGNLINTIFSTTTTTTTTPVKSPKRNRREESTAMEVEDENQVDADIEDSQLQLQGVDRYANITSFLCLYSKLIMSCPVYSNFFPSSSKQQKSSSHSNNILSSVLYAFAFHHSDFPLVKELWSFLLDNKFIAKSTKTSVPTVSISNNDALFVPTSTADNRNNNNSYNNNHYSSNNSNTNLTVETGFTELTKEKYHILSILFILCSTMSHQLLATDDDTFLAGDKFLNVENLQYLIHLLKTWLHKLLWSHAVVDANSDSSLVNMQLLYNTAKLFNQILSRNERRGFVSVESWHWPALSHTDLAVEYTGGGGEGLSNLTTIKFGNPRVKLVLSVIPQVIPFQQRVSIFQQLIAADKSVNDPNGLGAFGGNRGVLIKLRRGHLVEDAYRDLKDTGKRLKQRVQVSFVSEQGIEEAGIDGGGLFKEFIDCVTKAAYDPDFGLFCSTSQHQLVPSPSSMLSSVGGDHLEYFRFLGRILGKALYERILVEPQFAGGFLNALLGRQNSVDDLMYLDTQIYRSMMTMKAAAAAGGGNDLKEIGLFFEVTTKRGKSEHTIELVAGGSTTPVTSDNFIRYMHLFANFKLNLETKSQSRAFLEGCRDIIPLEWLRMFGPHELQLLIGGNQSVIDVEDLRQHTNYGGGYHGSQPYIQGFWDILMNLNFEEQSEFLKFVTSCSRQPLLGFGQLQPLFCIQKVPTHNAEDEASLPARLPSAATCMNLLKLPEYSSLEELRAKLLYAIKSQSRFELS